MQSKSIQAIREVIVAIVTLTHVRGLMPGFSMGIAPTHRAAVALKIPKAILQSRVSEGTSRATVHESEQTLSMVEEKTLT